MQVPKEHELKVQIGEDRSEIRPPSSGDFGRPVPNRSGLWSQDGLSFRLGWRKRNALSSAGDIRRLRPVKSWTRHPDRKKWETKVKISKGQKSLDKKIGLFHKFLTPS